MFCTLSLRKNVQVKLHRTSGTNTHRAKLHRTTINKLQPIEQICKSNPTSKSIKTEMPFQMWYRKKLKIEGCLTVHLPHEIMLNDNLMQQGNFIDVYLARHVSGPYAYHQEH